MTWTTVRDADQLTAMFGEPSFRAANKDRRTLHPLDVHWLAASPFCLMGTSDASGRCDVSPKGDPPGSLVHVIDGPRSHWPNGPVIVEWTATATFSRIRSSA